MTLAGSAQIGKTVIANIFLGGSMAMDPCDFLVVHPTDDNASRWSKLKLSPMLKGTASLRGWFPEKSRDGSNSVPLKEHRDGLGAILISGGNSPSSADAAILVFSMHLDPHIIGAAITAGATGYLHKEAPPHELLTEWRKSTAVSDTSIGGLP